MRPSIRRVVPTLAALAALALVARPAAAEAVAAPETGAVAAPETVAVPAPETVAPTPSTDPAAATHPAAATPVPVPAAHKPAAAAAGDAGNLPKRYDSPLRQQCEGELRLDAGWHAALADQLRREVRVADAKESLRNRRHLVIAYGAIWLGTMAFLVLLWRRQRGFEAEIARLSRDLAEATSDRD